MNTLILFPRKKTLVIKAIAFIMALMAIVELSGQDTICKVPWIPPTYDVTEEHWDVPQSFWQNGGHIPENVVNEDTTDYARAHIKATGSATLRVTDEDTVYSAGFFVGFLVKSRAFRDTIFDGVTITTYLDGVMQESYSGDHLWVEYVPFYVNDPICIGFFTTLPWNEIEIHFDTAGGKVHYDVFYAVINGPCNEELPPLPVTWLSFEVQKKGEASNLKWVTAQEFNNAGFYVERSADGRLFETIGTVDAQVGPRNFNEYIFLDESPLRGMNYYRIKQMDVDGKFDYSDVRSLSFTDAGVVLNLWPNPATESIHIEMPDGITASGEIKLINSAGVLVMSKTFEKEDLENSLDLRNVSPGLYSLIIESPESRYISKIVVLK